MDVTGTGAATAAASQRSSTASKSALSSDFETFLRMLTTQMQNQDPLNPMESTEFATQLATFSQVEQQTRGNELLSAMVAQLGIIGMSQVTAWVGKEARTSGPVWVDNRAVELAPDPAAGADQMAIIVRDKDGLQVGRLALAASDEPVSWVPTDASGTPLPAGAYSFELESLAAGKALSIEPLETYSRIVEVRNEGGTTQLILEGGVRLAPADATALRDPTA